MQTIKAGDPFVRMFHWSRAIGSTLDAVILDEDSRQHEQVGYVVLGLIGARLGRGLGRGAYHLCDLRGSAQSCQSGESHGDGG